MAFDDTRALVRRALRDWGDEPDPGFEARVERAVHPPGDSAVRPTPIRRRRRALPLGLIAAAAILALLASAFSFPLTRQALTQAFFGWEGAGIAGPTGGPTQAEATDKGFTIRVANSVDDGELVLIPWTVSHDGAPLPGGERVQVGTIRSVHDVAGNSIWNLVTEGESVLDNGVAIDRPANGPTAGTALTVEVSQLVVIDPNTAPAQGPGQPARYHTIDGRWLLRVTPARLPVTDLPVPAPLQVRGAVVKFTSVRLTGASLSIHYTIQAGKNDASSHIPIAHGPDGKQLLQVLFDAPPGPISTSGKAGVGPGPEGTWTFGYGWQLPAQGGPIRIDFQDFTSNPGPDQTITIDVPHGLSPDVPHFFGQPFAG